MFVFSIGTAVFCYMCGRRNQHFDPEKPERLQKAMEGKVREMVKMELDQEYKEDQVLSQMQIDGDGSFIKLQNTPVVVEVPDEGGN